MMTQLAGLIQLFLKTESLLNRMMENLLFWKMVVLLCDDEVSLDVPVTLTNLVSFFQGMRL